MPECHCTTDSSVVEWILEYPETRIFLESCGFDCSCAGRSLLFVCQQHDLSPEAVLAHLHAIVADAQASIADSDVVSS